MIKELSLKWFKFGFKSRRQYKKFTKNRNNLILFLIPSVYPIRHHCLKCFTNFKISIYFYRSDSNLLKKLGLNEDEVRN